MQENVGGTTYFYPASSSQSNANVSVNGGGGGGAGGNGGGGVGSDSGVHSMIGHSGSQNHDYAPRHGE